MYYINKEELKDVMKLNNRLYKLVKTYDRYALYEDQYGLRECFQYDTLGIYTPQEKRYRKKYGA